MSGSGSTVGHRAFAHGEAAAAQIGLSVSLCKQLHNDKYHILLYLDMRAATLTVISSLF